MKKDIGGLPTIGAQKYINKLQIISPMAVPRPSGYAL